MTDQLTPPASILERYPLDQIRRNHGLEHATLHVLARQYPRLPFAGHSDPGGFWIVGNVSTDDVRSAVDEALHLLRSGQRQLAVHPNCGTNLVTSGTLAGLAGALAMFAGGQKRRDQLSRLPLAISLATIALLVAQPLGLFLQARVTTSGDPGPLEIVEIKTTSRGRTLTHRVVTHDSL